MKAKVTEVILFMDGPVSLLISSPKSIDFVFLLKQNKLLKILLYFCARNLKITLKFLPKENKL